MTEHDRTRDPRGRAIAVALKRLGIIASVALNIGFLSGVLARSSFQGETPAASPWPAQIESSRSRAPTDNPGYGSYYEGLRSRGLTAEEAKTLLLVRLEAQARERAVLQPPPYWQRNEESPLESALRLAAELEHDRAALVEVFGDDVEHDPAFARLFRPLDPAFAFLSSAQQVAIQKVKLEHQMKVASIMAGASSFDRLPGAPSRAAAEAAAELAANLAAALDPSVLSEYLLRDSALADELRRSRVEFTEAEFRETYDVLRRFAESNPDRAAYASARNALRASLGGRRFAALWAGRDPLFAAVQRAGKKHALEEETVLSVYELFNDHQDNLLEVARSANGDLQRESRGVQEAQTRLEARLSGLVGTDVAGDIERSYVQQAMALSRQFLEE